jgi:hypothetical protein
MTKQNKSSRPATSKKQRYKVTNWPEYNKSLKFRANIQIWIPQEAIEHWLFEGEQDVGHPLEYSDKCIETCLAIKAIFHLPYRQLQGFIESILDMAELFIPVPDYTVLCRRSKSVTVSKDYYKKQGEETGITVCGDSTGLKVFGEGEWKVRKHGWNKHRTWQKLHVLVEPKGKIIVANKLTTNSVDDAAVVPDLIGCTEEKINCFCGDGAYDKIKVYKQLGDDKIRPIIPPRKNAKIRKHGNSKGKALQRDKNIRGIRKYGRSGWKTLVKYHQRSIAETTMFRYKTIISGKLYSKTFDRQQTEVDIACKILNVMTCLGLPDSMVIRNLY